MSVGTKLNVERLPKGLKIWLENYAGIDTSDKRAVEEYILENSEIVVRVSELLFCRENGHDR